MKGMLAGRPSAESARGLKGWKEAMNERRRLRSEGKKSPAWGAGKYRIPYSVFLDEDNADR